MIDYLLAGGPVMVPIVICSVVALAMFLERLWVLRREQHVPAGLEDKVLELVAQGRHAEALARCEERGTALGRLLAVALQERGKPRSVVKERLEELGRREASDMERGIPVIGTIASIAPLLGLLGTVGGMIVTFRVIQEQGLGNVGNLAGGISQALVTTFAGLTVGIPSVMANRYLLARVDALLLELEEASLEVLDRLGSAPEDPTS